MQLVAFSRLECGAWFRARDLLQQDLVLVVDPAQLVCVLPMPGLIFAVVKEAHVELGGGVL